MSRFRKWAAHEYSKEQRIIALFFLGILVMVAFPLFIGLESSYIDQWFHFPKFVYGVINIILALLIGIIGLLFALWAVQVQFSVGRGTPAPMMATQKLIIQKPYSYCRNPMTLGTIFYYLGITIWIGSFSAIGLTLLFTVLLLAYNKLIEEKELEERFGLEYMDYKRRTPFLIPYLWRRK